MPAPVPDPRPDAREPALEIEPVPVRVHFEQRDCDSPWQQRSWRLAAVEPGDADDPLRIRLYRDEAQGYYLNLTSGEPSILVLWRMAGEVPGAVAVTLSYDEAGRWMDGGETVERVPMPVEMVSWLAEYVQLHYRPEAGRKRRGTKPSFMRREEFAGMAAREAAGTAGEDRGDAREGSAERASMRTGR